MFGPSRNIPIDAAMCINLALAEGRFDDALQLIAAVMRLSGKQVSKETLEYLTELSTETDISKDTSGEIQARLN